MTKPLLIPTEHDTRTSIRQTIRTKRKALTTTFQKNAAQALLKTLQNNITIKKAQHLALYLANDGELDLMPFIQWCWQQNKQVYLPVLHPFSKGNLLFLRYLPITPMTVNQYGIAEPQLNVGSICLFSSLDVILTPLVAFDSTGSRLGMGGGFYDRTLQHSQQHQFIAGIAHDCQQVTKLPTESWDVPLAEIFTPTKDFII